MQIFRLATACKKINQIPYVIFQAITQFCFKFCITFQCHGTLFLWNFLAEEPIKVQFFRLLSALIKVHAIPHVISEITRSGFIRSFHLIYFEQKEPIEVKFSDFWVVEWNFTKFLMSSLKPQVSFSVNFVSLFSVMRDNSSVLFELKLYMIWTKGAHQSAKYQTFDCSRETSPSLYFDPSTRMSQKFALWLVPFAQSIWLLT